MINIPVLYEYIYKSIKLKISYHKHYQKIHQTSSSNKTRIKKNRTLSVLHSPANLSSATLVHRISKDLSSTKIPMIACKPPTSQNFTAKISPNPCYTRMLIHTYIRIRVLERTETKRSQDSCNNPRMVAVKGVASGCGKNPTFHPQRSNIPL